MYIRKTNNKTHKKYSIEEKNQIVLLYLDRHMGREELIRTYDIASKSTLHKWINQYRQYGTCIDERGTPTKIENPNKGRPRKTPERKISLHPLSYKQQVGFPALTRGMLLFSCSVMSNSL